MSNRSSSGSKIGEQTIFWCTLYTVFPDGITFIPPDPKDLSRLSFIFYASTHNFILICLTQRNLRHSKVPQKKSSHTSDNTLYQNTRVHILEYIIPNACNELDKIRFFSSSYFLFLFENSYKNIGKRYTSMYMQ